MDGSFLDVFSNQIKTAAQKLGAKAVDAGTSAIDKVINKAVGDGYQKQTPAALEQSPVIQSANTDINAILNEWTGKQVFGLSVPVILLVAGISFLVFKRR